MHFKSLEPKKKVYCSRPWPPQALAHSVACKQSLLSAVITALYSSPKYETLYYLTLATKVRHIKELKEQLQTL